MVCSERMENRTHYAVDVMGGGRSSASPHQIRRVNMNLLTDGLILERDAGAVAGKQAAVGDGDAVGIARQIGQHGFGVSSAIFS